MVEIAPEFLPIRSLEDNDSIEDFSCGVEQLDGWLSKYAKQAMRGSTACVYVMLSTTGELCGFYTLSMHSMARASDMPRSLRHNTPFFIPCTLLGQLAVDVRFQGMSVGARLLQDALSRALSASQVVASRALVVNPVDARAERFYQRFGFRPIFGSDMMYVKL